MKNACKIAPLLLLVAVFFTQSSAAEAVVDFLRITELHYHPANPTAAEAALGGDAADDTRYEFVELTNIGANPLDVSGVNFSAGITYVMPAGTIIPAGGRVVLVNQLASFRARYGNEIPVLGAYSGNLSNSGETLTLKSATAVTIQSFAFLDTWYPTTDGPGFTLRVANAAQALSAWGTAAGWLASSAVHGSPGYTDGAASGLPHFSQASGTFAANFNLTITADDPTSVIRYTTDGTVPTSASPIYSSPISITATTRVRAFVKANALPAGQVNSAYYVKLDSSAANFATHLPVVVVDTYGAAVPANTSASRVMGALTVLPAPAAGAANVLGARTAELIARVGVREHGSSSAAFPKQSLGIEAWDEANQDSNIAPLGMPNGEDWALIGPYNFDSAFIRNAVVYELSNRIGRYAPRLRFCEVFANHDGGDVGSADYQGVFIFVERVKRGSSRVDIEKLSASDTVAPAVQGGYIVKIDRSEPDADGITIAAGTSQEQVVQMVYPDSDAVVPEQKAWLAGYLGEFVAAIQAPDFVNPTTGKHYSEYIDVDSWIDHHIMNVLFMNVDALRLSAYMYKTRDGKLNAGPVWDFDQSADSKDPRDDNPYQMNGDLPSATDFFGYTWWNRLFADPDFAQRYADRMKELLATKMTVSELHGLVDQFALPLNATVSPETNSPAARDAGKWPGDGNAPRNFTQGDVTVTGYLAEATRLKAWLTNRLDFLGTQWLDAPIFSKAGGTVDPGYQLTLSSPIGSIYYTVDGSDPRAPGGAPAASSVIYAGPITISEQVTIKARVRNGTNWSPMSSGKFSFSSALPIRVTEIMYNPSADANPSSDDQLYEFIELKNVSGTDTIDLTGIKIAGGIDFAFTGGSLAPKALVLVVADQAAFESRYGTGKPIAGVYTGRLDNAGDPIRLLAADNTEVLAFAYNNAWYPITDGQGPSLVINDPFGAKSAWNIASSWRPSYDLVDGSPGEDENSVPVATGESYTVPLNQQLPLTVAALTANDTDADPSDVLSVKRMDNPSSLGSAFALTKGTVSLAIGNTAAPGAVITYVPPPNFYGTDYFSYRVVDLFNAESNVVSVQITVATPPVRINEFFTHTDTPNYDGVELLNPTPFPVNIGGWRVAKTPSGAGSDYNFPSGTILAPGALITVKCDATDGNGAVVIPGDWHTTLSPRSGALYLLPKVDGVLQAPISGTTYPVSLDGQSFGYWETSDGRVVYPIERIKTVNSANTGPNVGPIIITEIMYAPQPGEHQFIELQNISPNPIPLDRSYRVGTETVTLGWRMDGVTFSFAPGTSLNSGQICVLVDGNISPADFRAEQNLPASVPVYNFSGTLNLSGARLALQQAENFNAESTMYWLTRELVEFKNGGLWPTVTGGSNRSIVRRTRTDYGDDPANWTLSQDAGGSPGTAEGASPPNTANDEYAINPGASLVINAPGVLGNDTDPDGDAITAVFNTNVANGVLTFNTNGSLYYKPNAGFNGIDSFTYQAKDSTGLMSGSTTVFFNVGRSQLDARIIKASDDAEEHEDGIMDLSSTDLELTYDAKVDGSQPRGHQWIAMRYEGLNIPVGALITSAYIQFSSTAEIPESGACALTIRADDSDNASTFHDDPPGEISARPRTTAAVNWAPQPWTVANETSLLQRTPNLAAVVQEVVSRPGWSQGNAMAFLINGTGKRVAHALDGAKPELCPKLHVEWRIGGPYGNPDSYTVAQDQTLNVSSANGVLANDGTLGDIPTLSAVLVSGPANGTLTLNANGSFAYAPIANLTGPDQFSYRVSDGVNSSSIVTVNISVLSPSVAYAAGLAYEYWWGALSNLAGFNTLGEPIKTGAVSTLDITPRDQDDNFAFRYRGFIDLPSAGAYTFYLKSDDGSDLYIDGSLVVNNDGLHGDAAEISGIVNIATPGKHAIEVRFFEREGSQSLAARYEGPGIAKQLIPAAVLSRQTQDRVIANNDAYSVAQNGTLTVSAANHVMKNDVSALGTPITVMLVSGPTLGTLSSPLAANGTFVYQPTAGIQGYDSFTYRCTDGANVSNLATVNITVGAPGAAQPVANADFYTINSGKVLTVGIADGLLSNDTDPNGDSLKSIVVSLPSAAQGALAGNKVELDGRFTFTPKAGFVGTATFTYKCNDGTFDSAPGTVTIEVLPPSPLDEYAVLRTGGFTEVGKDLSGITWNPDTNTYFVISNDTNTLASDGRKVQIFEFLPDLTTFVRGIKITQSDASSPFEDKNSYDAEDIAYLGNGDFAIAYEGHVAGNPAQYMPNRVCIVHIDSTTLSVNTNAGQCIRINLPDVALDNNGLEGLTYDRNGNGGLGVFYGTQEKNLIKVWRFNRPANRTLMRDYDAVTECALSEPFNATALLENQFIISDLSGVAFDERTGRLLLVSDEGQALVDVDLSGHVIGQFALPSSLNGGADQYEGITIGKDYNLAVVSEPNVFTELYNFTLPVAENDTYSTSNNTTLIVSDALGVLANDSDGNGEVLTAQLVTAPVVGTVTLASNGGFTYVPPSGFLGTITFTYKAFDGHYLSQLATVTLNVNNVDHAPVAQPDSYTLAEDSTFSPAVSVLANDSDSDGDPKFAVIGVRPLHGTLSLRADGKFTYIPVADYNGSDSFTYRCRAGSIESAAVTVSLSITPVNDAPVAVPEGPFTTAEDVDLVQAAPGVLANDYDIDGDSITAEVVAQPAHGTLTLASNGSFTYHPNAGYHGPDLFRYRARDAALPSLDVQVSINVTSDNDAPTAAADSITILEDQVATLAAPGVLANDSDPEGQPLSVGQVVSQPQHGTLTLGSDGALQYVPLPDWNGTDSFAYTAFDGEQASVPATVTINVTPVDDAGPAQTPYGGAARSIPGTIQAEDFDIGGQGIAYSDADASNNGGSYRTGEAVDIESYASGAYNVGWIRAGEWLEYSVNVTAAGPYTLTARVASAGVGGTFHVEFNGANATGALSVPNSGGWATWTTVITTVNLSAGSQIMRIAMDTNGATGYFGNLDSVTLAPGSGGGPVQAPYGGTARAIPGTIEAEDFDTGGQGIAYSDADPANNGGKYRIGEGVDIESYAAGANNIGWVMAGEWLEYSVNVTAAGAYTMTARVASAGNGGTFHVEFNGADKSGTRTVPNTGAWGAWQSLTFTVNLSAGPQIMRIAMDANGATGCVGNFDAVNLVPDGVVVPGDPTQTPYTGTPMAIPGTILTAQYDNGGEGIAYHDTEATNFGSSSYRPGQGVDSVGTGVGWIRAGEWLEYTVNVASSGVYALSIPISHPGTGGSMHVSFDGVNATGSLSLLNTGAWDAFQNIVASVNLTAGVHVMQVAFDTNGSTGYGPGLGDIVINNGGSNVAPTVSLTAPANGANYSAPAAITLTASASDSDGTVASVGFYQGATLIGTDTTSPYSFTWNNVAAGSYTLSAKATDNNGVSATSGAATVTVNAGGTQTPYSGTPMAIPGTILTAHYDNGGEGVAYHDEEAANLSSGSYRIGQGVDSNGSGVGWIRAGEWLEYTVNVASSGVYTLSIPISHPGTGGSMHVSFDGINATGSLPLLNTGSWGTYQNIVASANLTAGVHVVQVAFDTNGSTGYGPGLGDIVITNSGSNAAPTVSLTAPANGATYSAPAAITLTASASDSDGAVASVEFYQGATLIGSDTTSPYSFTWNNVAAGSYVLSAKARDNIGATTTSATVDVSVTAPLGLPAPWQQKDIGFVGLAGSGDESGGAFTVRGSGSDIWNDLDAFHFVYQQLSGDGSIVARVASQQNTDPWAKAGVMVRESVAAGSRHALMVVTPGNGTSFQRRTSTSGFSSHTSPGDGKTAPCWVKLVRSGATLSGYQSGDGVAWTLVGTDTVAMDSIVLIGLAVTAHNNAAISAATLDNVTLTGDIGPILSTSSG